MYGRTIEMRRITVCHGVRRSSGDILTIADRISGVKG